jgi:hypothetical protein
MGSRDSAVGIATDYGLGYLGVGVRDPVQARSFPLTTSCRPVLRSTQPPIQRVLGAVSPGVKRLESEANHSLPTSAEVKHTWIYTSTSPIRLHGVVLNYEGVGK